MALLFVDVLGTKSRVKEGQEAVRRGIRALEGALVETLEANAADQDVRGAIESDSAGLQFDHAEQAIDFGIELFKRSFMRMLDDEQALWLRGVIVPSNQELLSRRTFDKRWPGLTRIGLSPGLLRAVITEKRGYRGMRLLVALRSVEHLPRERFGLTIGGALQSRFRKLDRIADSRELTDFREVLWMWTVDAYEWAVRRKEMDRRLLVAGRDSDEFVQAAATELIFKRCEDLGGRAMAKAASASSTTRKSQVVWAPPSRRVGSTLRLG